ncbi:hypothetical protein [Dapis sp. BLCC M172]
MFIGMTEFDGVFNLSVKALDWLMEWNTEAEIASSISKTAQKVVEKLIATPGMTMAHSRDFSRARRLFTLKDGTTVKVLTNPVGVNHVFLADSKEKMIFGGYVGWVHNENFNEALNDIKK